MGNDYVTHMLYNQHTPCASVWDQDRLGAEEERQRAEKEETALFRGDGV